MSDDLEILIDEEGHITEKLSTLRPGCIGQLSGPIAEWSESTRNDRYYSRKLWERVFDLDWVKEALSTHTLFGEADHPQDRLESRIKEAAVVLTDYRFDESSQTLYGTFDILDTPNGRILRTLSDYGCELGVSSRGRGRIVTRNGKNCVDENSYIFGGFDIVVLPAVKKARQTFTDESVDPTNSVKDSIKSQIEESSSVDDLRIIKNILKTSELDESSDLTDLIDKKINKLSNSDNTIITGLTKDLKEAYARISKLEKKGTSRSDADTISTSDFNEVYNLLNETIEKNSSYSSVVEALKDQLKKANLEIKSLKESSNKKIIVEDKSSIKKIDELTSTINDLKSKLSESEDNLSEANKSLSEINKSLNESSTENDSLKSDLESLKSSNEELVTDNKDLNEQLDSTISDYNGLVDEYNSLIEENSELLDYYLSQQSSRVGISKHDFKKLLPENYKKSDIDNLTESQLKFRKKMNKLPMSSDYFTEVGEAISVQNNHPELESAKELLKSMKG